MLQHDEKCECSITGLPLPTMVCDCADRTIAAALHQGRLEGVLEMFRRQNGLTPEQNMRLQGNNAARIVAEMEAGT